MYPPRKYLEEFTRDHPRLALFILACGTGLMIFTGWLVVSDWRVGR
jgi:hypothetical protein